MNKEKLKEILELHRKWLFNIDGGIRADLRYANLISANLRSADLRSADLRSANLSSADLSSADLRSADLRSADLRYADLSSADLSSADLSSADLRYANLSSAKTDKRYIQISCVGSRKGITTYCFDDDIIICGCFRGTLDDFKIKVLGSYPDSANQFHREYIGIINYLEGLK